MSRKIVEYEVEGACPFPLDMLRYDAAMPSSRKDVEAIVETHTAQVREIRIIALVSLAGLEPAKERWQSFRWSVVPGSIQKRSK